MWAHLQQSLKPPSFQRLCPLVGLGPAALRSHDRESGKNLLTISDRGIFMFSCRLREPVCISQKTNPETRVQMHQGTTGNRKGLRSFHVNKELAFPFEPTVLSGGQCFVQIFAPPGFEPEHS